MKIKCIIIDDEPLARKGMAEYVADVAFLELAGEFENPVAAGRVLNEQKIDLIFLDIQMPRMTGLEFLKTLREPPMIVITTAYSEYALQAFELAVMDYLLKPISYHRFFKAVNKVKEFHELKAGTDADHRKPSDYFFIRCNNCYEKIFFSDLLFVEALENYVSLQTVTKKFISYLSIKTVEDYLPAEDFIKVHKSFVVSKAAIDKIDGNEIKIKTYSIPMSRSLKDGVLAGVVNNVLLKRS